MSSARRGGLPDMRPLILKMELSLDGFAGTTDGDVEWIFRTIDDELAAHEVELLGAAGLHAMGRVTYQDMAGHWPTSTEPYAAPMNDIPKVVFSRTLERADWGPVRIASGDLAEEVAALKAESGGPILAHGGAGFARALSSGGLVDEYRLHVHPEVLGAGLPIFADPAQLRLRGARTFAAGTVVLHYERADG
jgi:dihydrofolate reductase